MVSAGVNFGVDLAEEIAELKRERNAVILAHNYQVPEIQEIADYVGDSLGLSYKAAETNADVIVFCGVHFMAETAKIVNPAKRVVLPDLDAGCSLSESCPPDKLEAFLKEHAEKNYYVIAYINCSAGVKALSDVICTSGNAEKIVRARAGGSEHSVRARPKSRRVGDGADRAPDGSLAGQLLRPRRVHRAQHRHDPRRIPGRAGGGASGMHLTPCACWRTKFAPRKRWSTYCRESPREEFIIVTEAGMLHRLHREMPGKTFIPGPTENCSCAECRFMKMNTLEKARQRCDEWSRRSSFPKRCGSAPRRRFCACWS